MAKSLHEEIMFSTDFGLMNSPAFYDCCIHLICNDGNGKFRYNGNLFEIGRDEIAVMSHPHAISCIEADENFQCEYLAAPNKFLHNLLPSNNYAIQGCVSLFDNPIIQVDEEDAARFRRDLENIRVRVGDNSHHFYQEMIGSLLQTMMYDLFDFHIKVNDSILTTDRVGYISSQFFALIQAGKPAKEREVSYYADQLHVTPKYLSDTIKRVSGVSASTHINRAAAAIILEQLKNNRLSITQIAEEMNFTSLSYFSRYCTKNIGMSPAQFRTVGATSDK